MEGIQQFKRLGGAVLNNIISLLGRRDLGRFLQVARGTGDLVMLAARSECLAPTIWTQFDKKHCDDRCNDDHINNIICCIKHDLCIRVRVRAINIYGNKSTVRVNHVFIRKNDELFNMCIKVLAATDGTALDSIARLRCIDDFAPIAFRFHLSHVLLDMISLGLTDAPQIAAYAYAIGKFNDAESICYNLIDEADIITIAAYIPNNALTEKTKIILMGNIISPLNCRCNLSKIKIAYTIAISRNNYDSAEFILSIWESKSMSISTKTPFISREIIEITAAKQQHKLLSKLMIVATGILTSTFVRGVRRYPLALKHIFKELTGNWKLIHFILRIAKCDNPVALNIIMEATTENVPLSREIMNHAAKSGNYRIVRAISEASVKWHDKLVRTDYVEIIIAARHNMAMIRFIAGCAYAALSAEGYDAMLYMLWARLEDMTFGTNAHIHLAMMRFLCDQFASFAEERDKVAPIILRMCRWLSNNIENGRDIRSKCISLIQRMTPLADMRSIIGALPAYDDAEHKDKNPSFLRVVFHMLRALAPHERRVYAARAIEVYLRRHKVMSVEMRRIAKLAE
jgi:hypothetical protein